MRFFLPLLLFLISYSTLDAQHSVAREWNEVLLKAIRNDFARPTVHARNLWHTSMGMYDAWAVYGSEAEPYILNTSINISCPFDSIPTPADIQAAREEAISFVAYRLIYHRFDDSPGSVETLAACDTLMSQLGYDPLNFSLDYSTGDPAALGNYIANCIRMHGLADGSREQSGYDNFSYQPVNSGLITDLPGNPVMEDPNRWQPLTLDVFIDQSGNPIPFNTPEFLSPEWGQVTPFALVDSNKTVYNRNGFDYWVYHDPGNPPYLDTTKIDSISEMYKWGFSMVSVWQSHLDPADSVMIDISPASIGNIQEYPTSFADYPDFYNFYEGGDPSIGRDTNPKTGMPYTPQLVPRADYARVLAEFWADGPDSETPPGHWFTIMNYVSDHPLFEKRYRGQGPVLDDLEWDIKSYFMMGGAMHDAAVTAWGIKGWYDYPRPISAIRRMAEYGQSSDSTLPNYHVAGIPLIPGYIELVEPGDPLAGTFNVNVNKIKLYTWLGHDYISNTETDYAGVGWILAENWWPYQRPSFVTPPFAGYVSGHSTYSRAAAEILTSLTGDEYFPGGMGEFHAEQNEFLEFEDGPSVDLTLQWATYRDASDQTSLSRIWGGIHPPADDIPGRLMGMQIGWDAFNLAEDYFYKDEDNDGYYTFEDCDDNNPFINPGQPEICNGWDDDCDGMLNDSIAFYVYYKDADNDSYGDINVTMDTCLLTPPMGWVTNNMDCNDLDSLVNPSMPEICDGIDNNCSGAINDSITFYVYYKDADNDSYGDINTTMDTCLAAPPMGWVMDSTDCNDLDSLVNPGAIEICDGIDNNCSGFINDGIDFFVYYKDADNDSFGDSNFTLDTCLATPPMGWANNNLDCNDADDQIHPDATEVCDGADNNCDGQVNEGLEQYLYYIDADNDGFGDDNLAGIDSCAATTPTGYAEVNGDCDDTNGDIYPGATEILDNGVDEDCDGVDLLTNTNNPIALQTKIFPNPAKDFVRIESGYSGDLQIVIKNINNQVLYQTNHSFDAGILEIDIQLFSNGLYLVEIIDSETHQNWVEKLVVF